jgi:V8-like Glu-specific endopeptidase
MLRSLLLFGGLAAAALVGCSAPAEEDEAVGGESAIIEGARTNDDPRYAAVVAIVRKSSGKTFCTGSLIAPDLVITANHCVNTAGEELGPAEIAIAFGGSPSAASRKVDVTGFDRSSLSALPNDTMTGGQDATVLKLASPVTDVPVLATGGLSTEDIGKTFTAIGYGFSDAARTKIGIRRVGTTKLVAFKDDFETEVGVRDESARICQGDSGGPLLAERDGKLTVVAILSRGALNAQGECENPATYVRLVARACSQGGRVNEHVCEGDVYKRCGSAGAATGPSESIIDCAAMSRRCDPNARGFACVAR